MPNRYPDCEAIEPLLAPYADADTGDVLGEADRARVRAHLDACPPCRAHAEAASSGRRVLAAHAGALSEPAPPLLTARCRAAAARATTPRRAMRWAGWTALAGAAAALLFIVMMPAQAIATQLAVDHVKCAKFSVASAMHGSAVQLEQRWRERQAESLHIPDGAALGLTLVGLRRCYSTDGGNAHVMYERAGAPLSLFVMRRDGAAGRAAPGALGAMGHTAILWNAGAATYVLVGTGAGLNDTAAAMRRQLEERGMK